MVGESSSSSFFTPPSPLSFTQSLSAARVQKKKRGSLFIRFLLPPPPFVQQDDHASCSWHVMLFMDDSWRRSMDGVHGRSMAGSAMLVTHVSWSPCEGRLLISRPTRPRRDGHIYIMGSLLVSRSTIPGSSPVEQINERDTQRDGKVCTDATPPFFLSLSQGHVLYASRESFFFSQTQGLRSARIDLPDR